MSTLNEYRQKQEALEKLQQEMAALEESQELKSELEFFDEAKALLAKFNKTPEDFAQAFSLNVIVPRAKSERKARVFKHPNTGEEIIAKSTNNKQLRQWATELNVDVASLEVSN